MGTKTRKPSKTTPQRTYTLTSRQLAAGSINEAVSDWIFDTYEGAQDDAGHAAHVLRNVTAGALKSAAAMRRKSGMKQPSTSWPCSRTGNGDPLPELATLDLEHGDDLALFLRLQLTLARSNELLELLGPFYWSMSRGAKRLDLKSPAVIDAYARIIAMASKADRTLRADLAASKLTAAELLGYELEHWARNPEAGEAAEESTEEGA